MSLKRQRTHQPTPFQLKKEIRRGKSQKKAKGAAGGARPPFGGQPARLRLAFGCEMGSDFGVKSHQNSIFTEIAALWGGFFSGGAQRLPAVRRGESGNGARREPRFFVTAASGGVHGKIEEQPIHHSKLLFLALDSRLGQFRLA